MVLQDMLALGEPHHQEPVVSVEDSDDEAIVRGSEQVEDGPDCAFLVGRGDPRSDTWFAVRPTDKKRKEYRNPNNPSDNTHAVLPLFGFHTQLQRGRYAQKH